MSAASDSDGVAISGADPIASITAQFSCLAIEKGWKKGSTKYKKQRESLVADEFEAHFGGGLSDLGGWQALCKAVGIAAEEIPSSITKCKKVRPMAITAIL